MTQRLLQKKCSGRSAWMLCGISLLLLSGCTVGPDFVRPKIPPVDHYNHGQDPAETVPTEGQSQRFEQGVGPVANWWKLFNSKQLDAAVAEGLTNNPSLEAAQANLRQSNDNLQAGYGIFYPQISADFSPTRQKYSPARIGSSAPGSIFNLVTLSASISYPLDLFGAEHRAIENLQSQVDLQRSTVLGTYLALSGNIVNTTIAMAAYQDEIKYTEQLIALLKDQIAITEKQTEAGVVSYEAVLSLRSQLASLEATLPPLRQRVNQSEHLLATLAGHAPSEWTPAEVSMAELSLPSKLPLSLPSELLRQRPDILVAEAQLHSASANIGVATAAQFPSFTLNGTFGQNASSMNGLFGSNANFWSLGADLATPLFNGGTLSSRKQAAVDAYQQSQALYRQTVLAAFAQVADAVRALEHDAETMQAETQSVQTSEEALRLTQINYQAGLLSTGACSGHPISSGETRLLASSSPASSGYNCTICLTGWRLVECN